MPDALSKTIPIWCAVMNRLLFPEIIEFHALHTPVNVVGDSEHIQIEAKLNGFATDIKVNQLGGTIQHLAETIARI